MRGSEKLWILKASLGVIRLIRSRPISVSMSPVALEFARSDPTFSKMVVDRQAMYTLTPPALPADEKGK